MSFAGPHQTGPFEPRAKKIDANYSFRKLIRQFRTGLPRAQLASLAEQTPVNTAVTLSLVVLIWAFVVTQVSLPWMHVWASVQAGLILVVFLRWRSSTRSRAIVSDSPTPSTRLGLRRAVIWAALSGGIWGSLTAFLPSVTPHIQLALILSMAGMAAGAATTLSAVPQVAIVFILACDLPATIYHLMKGDQTSLMLALVFAIFTVAMIVTSQIVYVALLRQLRAEEQTRELQETRAKNYLDVTASTIFTMDTNANLTLLNRAGCRLFVCEESAVVGHNGFELFVSEKTRQAAGAKFAQWMRGEEEISAAFEANMISLSGAELIIRWQLARLKDARGNLVGVLGSGQDMTEQRRIEKQLQQAQKMEAFGQLASGIAHDFNNVLAVVIGNIELAIGWIKERRNVDECLSAALQEAQKGADLNKQLLTFSRQQFLEEKVVNVNEVISGMSSLLGRTLGEDIEIETVFSEEDCFGKLDRAQLESAILNLAINARDAMPRSGKLRIETRISLPDTSPDEMDTAEETIRISVTDSGSGMTAEVKEHALEPFYTTKEVGAGSGLGLSMVYGFVTQSGGGMKIDTELAKGTTIHITLPIADMRNSVLSAPDVSEIPVAGDGEVILVVEDQCSVRDVIVRQLIDLGYDVLEAEDGNRALQILEKSKPIDLILSDMVLPGGMGGEEVVLRATAIQPDLKCLHMSGNLRHTNDSPGMARASMLHKPFQILDLARAVRNCLEGR